MRVALAELGMKTEQQDLSLGHLGVAAKAPLPLTDDEWRRASDVDLPLLRRLIEPHVGAAASFVQFEPQGLEVVINATFLEVPGGTEVSLTVRLREIAPAALGLAATGVRVATRAGAGHREDLRHLRARGSRRPPALTWPRKAGQTG
jgi:hypothetical protein